jgi:integrase
VRRVSAFHIGASPEQQRRPGNHNRLSQLNFSRTGSQRRGQTKALLWPWSRMTAFRRVQEVIAAAGIPDGPHACPKGLLHGFGVQAVSRGIALNMVQKWLGHAQLTTTAIYANAVGEEEQSIAARMW